MSPIERPLKILAILGSVRPGNYTGKVLNLIAEDLSGRDDVTLDIIDPSELDLKLPGMGSTDSASRLQKAVKEADGIILATPEYHGSYSSVTKLVIDNLGFPSALKGKPVSLLGVASGSIGAIKALEHLRSVASHVGAIVLPGPVSVANGRSEFDGDGHLINPDLKQQVIPVADRLLGYISDHICPALALEAIVRGHWSPDDISWDLVPS